jgi:hypothetical protein
MIILTVMGTRGIYIHYYADPETFKFQIREVMDSIIKTIQLL